MVGLLGERIETLVFRFEIAPEIRTAISLHFRKIRELTLIQVKLRDGERLVIWKSLGNPLEILTMGLFLMVQKRSLKYEHFAAIYKISKFMALHLPA